MTAGRSEVNADEIPRLLKLQSLRRVAASAQFARSEQLRAMLTWLCERAIEGTVPTEYEVATGPLKRSAGFDPQTESLVRKEMNRMRTKLRAYYSGEGRADAIRIVSAYGYRVDFQPAFVMARSAEEKVCVLVLPPRARAVAEDYLDAFYEALLLELARIDGICLIAQTTARFFATRSGDIRLFAAESGADYVIEGTARPRDADVVTTLWAVEGRTGHTGSPCMTLGGSAEEQALRAAVCLGDLIVANASAAAVCD